jgi:hypothetical protein
MPQPTPSDVHAVDVPLTDFSLAFAQDPANFVSRRVAPVIGQAQQSNRYYTYTASFFHRSEAQQRGPGDPAATRGYELSTDTYSCDVWAIAQNISRQTRANADTVLDVESDAALTNMQDLMIREELLFNTAAHTAANWDNSGTPGTLWSDSASTPIEDIDAQIDVILTNTGKRANTITMGRAVWTSLKHHPDIIARISGGATSGSPAIVTTNLFAQLLELDNVYISNAVQNTKQEGITASNAFVVGKHALLCYTNPNPTPRSATAMATFVWSGYTGNTTGFRVNRYDWEYEDAYPRIETETAVDFKVVSSALGYHFTSCVA